MKILITGDLHVSDPYRGKTLWDPQVAALFAAADFRLVNLEAPITAGRKEDRILKTGPHIQASAETILPVLAGLRVDLAALANNHILDYGRSGLEETLRHLKDAGIGAVGAGPDAASAAAPYVLEKDGSRLAVLNFGENEWSGAGPGRAGANTLDLVENVRQIREARRACDAVLVVIHGGQEDYHFPTPRMVRQYRFLAENGASAIVGHHPHCIGGFEVHQGCPIFYSLGNFLFTLPSAYDWWYLGLTLTLRFEKGREATWELTPVAQSRTDFSLSVLAGQCGAAVLEEVRDYSRIIADASLLRREWDAFLDKYSRYYLNIFNPLRLIRSDRVLTALTKLGLDRLFVTKAQYAGILNSIRCESHAEAARDVIEKHLE
jgi:poly-gamma-glutamate capsule biosynthesis protein CapA/YwtB (metallophosphatase superfamily)